MAEQNSQPGGAADPKLQVISRIRIIGVDAQKKKDSQITGLELNLELDQVTLNKKFLEIWFTYRVVYKEDVGHISLKGILILESDEKALAEAEAYYQKNKYFDSPWAENIANNINFKCATEAIFPSKIIDLPPPIMPPRINMSGQPGGGPGQPGQPGQPGVQSPFGGPPRKH